MGSSESNEAEHLGDDIICEISSRMPAKSSIKLLSLSKTLSNPLFVERQSIHSSRFDGGFFLQSSRLMDKLELHVLSRRDEDAPSTFGIPSDSLSFLEKIGRIEGSSHGLLLVCKREGYSRDFKFLICNPATRKWAFLPDMPLNSLNVTSNGLLFECHPRNLKANNTFPSDYTILVPNYWNRDEGGPLALSLLSRVHGLTVYHNGKWEEVTRDLSITGRRIRQTMPVGLFRGCNGGIVVHYLCDSIPCRNGGPIFQKPYLMTYDIDRKDYSRTFSLPEDAWKEEEDHRIGSSHLKIFKGRSSAGETVGLVRRDKGMLRVWMLEEYEQGGWRRVLSKTTAEIGVPEEEGSIVKGCCVMNGTELVFATGRRLYVYHMEGPHAGRLETVAENYGVRQAKEVYITLYANTLRPVCCGEST